VAFGNADAAVELANGAVSLDTANPNLEAKKAHLCWVVGAGLQARPGGGLKTPPYINTSEPRT
jgi:hypothetical protein